MKASIVTEKLSRRFGNGMGIHDLNLFVPEGSIYAFLGPNGAGKTTTIRCLLGLLRPDSGTILIDGIPIEDRMAALRNVGAMVETPALYHHLTGAENLEIGRLYLGAEKMRIAEVLATVGLTDAATRLVKQYSLGMRQRLAIAQALLGRPRLLILDEPSNGLDPAGMADMRKLIREMAGELGITVFLSSHLLADVEQVATHVALLHEGRLKIQAAMDELRTERLVIDCDEIERAIDILRQSGETVSRHQNGTLHMETPRQSSAAINARLVRENISVSRLALERNRLEETFLEMTRYGQEQNS